MNKPTLMSECKTDAEKIRLWRDLLKSEDMTIKSAVNMIEEDPFGDWIPGKDPSGSYITIPDFQRDYSYSSKQKTALIESILLNIPINSILVYQKEEENGTRTLPTIDGQHRLKTIYDFVNDRFKLNGKHLMFLKSLAGKKFSDFDPEFKHTFYDYTLTVLKARNNGEDILETIEEFANQCFIRTNENPNTMSPYTLLKAKYSSFFLSEFDHMLNVVFRREKEMRDMFSVSRGKDRYKLDITAALYMLNYGLHPKTKDIKSLAEFLFVDMKEIEESVAEERVEEFAKSLNDFHGFLRQFNKYGVSRPLTHEIFGDKEVYYGNIKKGIMIRMALIYYVLSHEKKSLVLSEELFNSIQETFREAYKGDATLKYNNLKHFLDLFKESYSKAPVNS
ncbi:DUF262 domain-containing protein (plasmid) [Rossellomorea sp. AcN35-11]|nr:DUF262 domain-containing protein [Rossellomorea aquimaris]WJV31899.1 DUF262 domain-containing protein [Rossellomorea sp. AcN35-11]